MKQNEFDDVYGLFDGMSYADLDNHLRELRRGPVVSPTKGWDTPIRDIDPHYTDPRFRHEEHTVWGKADQKGVSYAYSDRLWQWDYKKSQAAFEAAKSSGAVRNSARYYQTYLTEYYGKSVQLVHIVAGVNGSNGYPYQAFGYRFSAVPGAEGETA